MLQGGLITSAWKTCAVLVWMIVACVPVFAAESPAGNPANVDRAFLAASRKLDAVIAAKTWSHIPSLGDRARAGDAEAQFELAVAYATGKLVAKDGAATLQLLRKASEQGHADAMNTLAGYLPRYGRSPEERAEAISWYRKAAQLGHSGAQASLATAYAYGSGVQQDYALAFQWDAKAAEQGNAAGQLGLAMAYTYGRGVPKDDRLALEWAQKAAETGNQVAQHFMGLIYAEGQLGVMKDMNKAIEWWRRSAAQGFSDPMTKLSGVYTLGEDVPQDNVESLMWVTLASRRGTKGTEALVKILKDEMSPDEVAEALRRADAWVPKLIE